MSPKPETMDIEVTDKEDSLVLLTCRKLALNLCFFSTLAVVLLIVWLGVGVLLSWLVNAPDDSTNCVTGFQPAAPTSLCEKSKFPFACDAIKPCPGNLICHAGKCSCKYPEHQDYVYDKLQCESNVGGPCGKGIQCLKFAECQLFSNRSTGLCKCRRGTTVNSDFTCDPDYPIDCRTSTDCKPFANFECPDGTCTCKAGATFSKEERACVKLVGTPCKTYLSDVPCVKNGRCINPHGVTLVKSSRYDDGVCKCNGEYEMAPDRTCQKVADKNSTTTAVI